MTANTQTYTQQNSTGEYTLAEYRKDVQAFIGPFASDVFGALHAKNTDSILNYWLVQCIEPVVQVYQDAPNRVQGLLKTIWPNEHAIVTRYLEQGELQPTNLLASVVHLLASDDTALRIFEALLIFANVIPLLEEGFHSKEWLLWQVRRELHEQHRRGRFQRLDVTIPSEQLHAASTSRGDLQIAVSTSKPTIVAGEEFSVFVVISNPFEVPITLYSVETQIPVEILDIVERQRRRLALIAENPELQRPQKRVIDSLLGATWDRWQMNLRLALQQDNRIAQAIAASEAESIDPHKRLDIMISQHIEYIDRGNVVGAQIGGIDVQIHSASPQHLDALLWRLESFKRGLTPITLQPGNSVVKQFIFCTKSWLLFTPLAHNMQIQVRYSVDDRDHLDTVPFQLTVQAAITATMTGAVIGGLAGGIARALSHQQNSSIVSNESAGVVSVLLAMILSAIIVVSFARKSGVQQIVSVEDFWGGLFIGFLVGFWGQSFALNLLTPGQAPANAGLAAPAPSPTP